ncbi:MAG TPA: Uma2 family endonuclease [Ktedonobacterales bacterium]|nr:Uma2 family endonuclease [Ktedonobacterales bacterium]
MSAVPQRLLTAEEFAALPSEGLRLELVRGEITAMPPAFDEHGETTIELSVIVGQYIRQQGLGKIYAAETGFLIARNPDTVRAPDFAFIQRDRAPAARPKPGWVEVMPDLVAEVVSSGDRMRDVLEKVQMWLDVGVRLVWVVYPALRIVEVDRPGQAMVTLREDGMLDGEDVLPGFTAPVKGIFG